MPKLKARDKQTGEVFEFDWNGTGDPTDADIERLRPQPSAGRQFVGAMQDNPITSMVADPVAEVMDKGWAEALPVVGGMVGSLIGGKRSLPAAGLAAIGGGAGEAARSAIQGEPIEARNVLRAAAIQGGGELVGRSANAAARGGANALYRSNLKPSKNLVKEFPESVAGLLDDRVVISPRGQAKSQALIEKSVGEASAAASKADAAGAMPIFGVEAAAHYGPILDRLGVRERGGLDVGRDLARVAERRAAVINQPPQTVTQGVATKRELQKLADEALRARERGAQALSIDDEINIATGRGLKEATERRAPDIATANATTQRRIGGDQMLNDAVQRASNYSTVRLQDLIGFGAGAAGANIAGGNPIAGVGAYGLVRALTTPKPASMLAIGANELGKKVPFAQAVRAALLAYLAQGEATEKDKQP